ncbi:MAG: glutathione synthase [Pseudomonadaceae bacterium]|nr:glutathione synthase [Pseudomonadaceae bacterium]
MVHIAFVMDPIDSLSLKKDSTLAMIRAAQRRGWQPFYVQQADISLSGGEVLATMSSLRLTEPFVDKLDPNVAGEHWYELGEPERRPLAEMDVIFMRKDPPFDMNYIYTTYLLERVEEGGSLVVNKPASLRDCNEKFFATAFPQCCPPLIVSADEQELRDFHAAQGNTVFKKLDGMGGSSVFRVMASDPNIGVILETLTEGGKEPIMGQLYLPEISDGDKRILLIDGKPLPYALARIPKAGEARGNLAAGGTGVGRELTKRDRFIAEQLGPELSRRGLLWVGIDVIGDYLTEVNVTCPTCIRELDTQYSLDIAAMLMDEVAGRLPG